jgi:hypothetical protein
MENHDSGLLSQAQDKEKRIFVITGRGRVWVDAAITFTTQETLYGIH